MPGELATAGGVNRGGHTTIIFGDIVLSWKGRCAALALALLVSVVSLERGRRATRQYQLQKEGYKRRIVCDAGDRRVVDMIAI